MRAQALICDHQRTFTFETVILPEPGPDRILVKTLCSGVSIGTEFALIRSKISWGPYPLCVGYQGVGLVEAVGANVQGFSIGDRVYFRSNKWMELSDGTKVSAVSGTHCSYAVIDPNTTHGAALLPEGVADDVGSLFVMPAVALHGVDMANVRMGSVVLVYGCGLIGLGVVATCCQRGARVIAVDLQQNRLEVARKLGADYLLNAAEVDVEEQVQNISPGGADAVFEVTGIGSCIDRAVTLCKPQGKLVLQGNYGAEPISYHFLPAHGKRLTWFYPCDDGMAPCRRAVVKNMATGMLPWRHVITHRIRAAESPALYAAIDRGEAGDVVGAVLEWA